MLLYPGELYSSWEPLVCNLQSQTRTHAVLVIGLYELSHPGPYIKRISMVDIWNKDNELTGHGLMLYYCLNMSNPFSYNNLISVGSSRFLKETPVLETKK